MDKYKYSDAEKAVIERSVIPVAVYQYIDRHVATVALSDGFCELFCLPDRDEAYELMNHDMYRDTHPEDIARIEDAALIFATEGGEYSVIYRVKIQGEYRIIHAVGRHTYAENGTRLAVVWYTDEGIYDSEKEFVFKKALENELEKDSLYFKGNFDPLTGLPGMNYFFELAENAKKKILQEGEVPALLYLDFIGMKDYNITNGFAEGDKLIIEMARILTETFSSENCCHVSGDRFFIYTVETGLQETLLVLFEQCKEINGGKSLPLRVGIYLNSMEDVGVSVACDRAKMACNMNQGSAVSVYSFFNENLLKDAERRQYIISCLDRAIEEGWIQVYYQPLIRAASGYVCDEEALARWIDPVRGFLSPGDFIPILEDAKLIYKVDLCVTEQVLKKMKKIREAGLYVVPCSVNISRSDFEACDVVEEIRKRVDEAGIPRDMLTIEITESILGENLDYMRYQVERFHDLGFKVWMDDYGSGYSSPDILQSISFDTIKLDMQFMRNFDKNPNSRIIISSLIKMAIGLGIETVVEGVETEEQAEFLKEVGCTRLQGFYYSKPIPLEEVLKRYETGGQIGFENPEESEYYTAVGKVNLYDISMSSSEEEYFQDYFNTMPMMILELGDEDVSIIRANNSCRDFMRKSFGVTKVNIGVKTDQWKGQTGASFIKALIQCGEDGRQVIIDERTKEGKIVHLFIRRIAINPKRGVRALAVVVLGITDETMFDAGLTYGHVAWALSSDYIDMYYVNLENDAYVEYKPSALQGDIAAEKRGEDFFAAARQDALQYLYPKDREKFVTDFTKENVIRSIEENGAFTTTYRLLADDEPMYVNMKATYIGLEKNRIIIGVNNVDNQMKQQETMERIREERLSYSRIAALSGDYIAFYTVNPETNQFIEYQASEDYESLGVDKEGEDFFENSVMEGKRAVYLEDQDLFLKGLTKENVMRSIEENGVFALTYRIVIGGEPRYVCLKATLVTEEGNRQLIFGLSDIDDQVKRDQQYARDLSAARSGINTDELTGLKNKHAYIDVENQLNQLLEDKNAPDFAIVVLDVHGMKAVNASQGREAGDRLIKQGAAVVSDIFKNSPAFRVGRDDFVVFARGADYENIDELMALLRERSIKNLASGEVVVIGGMARYENDSCVENMYKRADIAMHENKAALNRDKTD